MQSLLFSCVSQVEIPTGLPLIYDVNNKCIRLLDDGSGEDPMERYNFGTAADLLFNSDIPNEHLDLDDTGAVRTAEFDGTSKLR